MTSGGINTVELTVLDVRTVVADAYALWESRFSAGLGRSCRKQPFCVGPDGLAALLQAVRGGIRVQSTTGIRTYLLTGVEAHSRLSLSKGN